MTNYLSHIAWLDAHQESMTELVTRWAHVNSGSRNLPGLDSMLALLDEAFAVLQGDREIVSFEPVDLVTGFLTDDGRARGRPVGVLFDPRTRALFIADDMANVVWRVAPAR